MLYECFWYNIWCIIGVANIPEPWDYKYIVPLVEPPCGLWFINDWFLQDSNYLRQVAQPLNLLGQFPPVSRFRMSLHFVLKYSWTCACSCHDRLCSVRIIYFTLTWKWLIYMWRWILWIVYMFCMHGYLL